MLAPSSTAAKKSDDDIGTNRANVADEVADDLVMTPLLARLFDAERESEVHRPREVLLRAVEPMNRQQLFGPQHPERLKDLRADLILSAVTASRRYQRRAHPAAVAHDREQRVVLVIRVRIRLHERSGRGEFPEEQSERDVARQFSDWLDAELGWEGNGQEQKEESREKKPYSTHK